jgi:hypothetical protein
MKRSKELLQRKLRATTLKRAINILLIHKLYRILGAPIIFLPTNHIPVG